MKTVIADEARLERQEGLVEGNIENRVLFATLDGFEVVLPVA